MDSEMEEEKKRSRNVTAYFESFGVDCQVEERKSDVHLDFMISNPSSNLTNSWAYLWSDLKRQLKENNINMDDYNVTLWLERKKPKGNGYVYPRLIKETQMHCLDSTDTIKYALKLKRKESNISQSPKGVASMIPSNHPNIHLPHPLSVSVSKLRICLSNILDPMFYKGTLCIFAYEVKLQVQLVLV